VTNVGKATSPLRATNGHQDRPYGKAAVVDAVLDAAEHEFLAKGPARVSTREVAARAGVSHALIFRHFGTKQELVRAVYLRHISRTWERLQEPAISLEALAREFVSDETYWTIIARVALDGGGPSLRRARQHHGMRQLVELVREQQDSGDVTSAVDAERLLALQFALTLGLVVLGPTMTNVLSIGRGSPRAQRQELIGDWLTLIGPQPG